MLFTEFLGNRIYKVNSNYCFVDNNKHVREFDYNIQGLIACKWAIITEVIKRLVSNNTVSLYPIIYTDTDIATLNNLEKSIVNAKSGIDTATQEIKNDQKNTELKNKLETAQQKFTSAVNAKKEYQVSIWARNASL